MAQKISKHFRVPHHDLDLYFWKDRKYLKSYSHNKIIRNVKAVASESSWVIEGIFSHLIESVVDNGDSIIWLDLSEECCVKHLYKREMTPSDFQVKRIREYYSRDSGSSRRSHMQLYDSFDNRKFKFTNNINEIDFLKVINNVVSN